MNHVNKAADLFDSHLNCAQAVAGAFAETVGLDETAALKATSGFGGGMGRSGGTCGALTGAILILGYRHGTVDPANKAAKLQCYEKVQQLIKEFKHRAGAVDCRDLLGFDMSTADGQQAAKQPGAFDRCDDFVRIAAEILEERLSQ